MLTPNKPTKHKRADFKTALKSGRLLRFPGAFSPLISLLIERIGFDGIYISGAMLANDLGYPDIGLTTLTEVAQRGRAIARVSSLPTLIDADTGFGETMNVARTIQELEDAGLCGCHLEDQVNPKRCGHLDGKSLVPVEVMAQKIQAAVKARSDDNFIIMARTDARSTEGIDQAIARAKAYIQAGADAIFPEALQNLDEFAAFRDAIDAPLLANMTEFGKSKLLTTDQLSGLGYNIVIYPVTTLRIAMKAVEDGLATIYNEGTQESLLDKMQHRKELYDLIRYEAYNQFDQNIFNFKI